MGVKIRKERFDEKFKEKIYVIISIAAVILLISFALGTVSTTEAALNKIDSPSGAIPLSSDEVEEDKATNEEPILVKNGVTWQLKKLRLK